MIVRDRKRNLASEDVPIHSLGFENRHLSTWIRGPINQSQQEREIVVEHGGVIFRVCVDKDPGLVGEAEYGVAVIVPFARRW